MSKPTQLKIAGTLPTFRTARGEWEGAFAALEEWEVEVERAAEVLREAKASRDEALAEFRKRSGVLREVMATNRQDVLDDGAAAPETT